MKSAVQVFVLFVLVITFITVVIGQPIDTETEISTPTVSEMYYKSPSQLFFDQPNTEQKPCSIVFKECRGKMNG